MISNGEIIFRLLLAALMGSIIGLERERLLWAPGLRTHMLVCVGSCLMMITSVFGFSDILGTPNVVLDPSRIASQVVSGIGFLGAGAILFRGNLIHGLTTAASIWSVAGTGLAIGGGLYFSAVAATAIILVILAGIKPLEEKYKSTNFDCKFYIRAKRGELSLKVFQKAMLGYSVFIKQFVVQSEIAHDYDEIEIVLTRVREKRVMEIIAALERIPCVLEVKKIS